MALIGWGEGMLLPGVNRLCRAGMLLPGVNRLWGKGRVMPGVNRGVKGIFVWRGL